MSDDPCAKSEPSRNESEFPKDDSLASAADDEGVITPAELINQLQAVWLNEKSAPDLLDYRGDIIDCVNEQITSMDKNLQKAKRGDVKASIHKLELDRIRYILCDYMRCRLQKVERFGKHVLDIQDRLAQEGSDREYLSPEEYNFAKQYEGNIDQYFHTVAIRHMPPNLQKSDEQKMIVKPDEDTYVFLRVNKDVEGVLLDNPSALADEEVIDFQEGDQHMMRYRPIAPLVVDGRISLI